VKNTTSDYPLLAGDINVFMDHNFVAKSDIPVHSPLSEGRISFVQDL